MDPVAFRLRDVTVRKNDAVLLSAVTVELRAGECTALVGPSGAGKSTLLRLLNRFQEPTSGQVEYHGQPLTSLDVLSLRRRAVLVAQRPTLLAQTVSEDVRFGAPELTDAAVTHLLVRVGLDASFATRETTTLSGGEAQRVCLARALALDPQVLLLDEPTSSLDTASASAVEDTIAGLIADDLTVILVSHDGNQARRLAKTVVVLDGGRVVDVGPPDSVAYLDIARPVDEAGEA